MTQMKRLFVLSGKERGFTLAEVIVAMAIISFVVLATWRVVTSSLHSITRQDEKIKALHISQAHLARLEAETFSRVVPENFVVPSAPSVREYQLESIIYNNQIVDEDGSGDASTGDFKLYQSNGMEIGSDTGWSYDPASQKITGIPVTYEGKKVYLVYEYYHLVDEGGTIPSSSGEGLKERTIKLVTSVGDTNGNGTPGEKSDILGDDLTDNIPLSPSDYESFDPQTRELTFIGAKQEHSVWIYYLPDSDTDSSGPGGTPDGYLDPTENSIVGVVVGNSYDPVAKTKEITVTEYWKQGGKIQKSEQKAYIIDR